MAAPKEPLDYVQVAARWPGILACSMGVYTMAFTQDGALYYLFFPYVVIICFLWNILHIIFLSVCIYMSLFPLLISYSEYYCIKTKLKKNILASPAFTLFRKMVLGCFRPLDYMGSGHITLQCDLGETSKFQRCGHQLATEVGNKW